MQRNVQQHSCNDNKREKKTRAGTMLLIKTKQDKVNENSKPKYPLRQSRIKQEKSRETSSYLLYHAQCSSGALWWCVFLLNNPNLGNV